MKVLAFVPAKGDSTRIRAKNTAILDGDYIFKRKLRQLLDCPEIDEIILDTDSDSLRALAEDLYCDRLRCIPRPADLATNATDGHALFAYECGLAEADIYIQALCTSPFITAETISRALKALRDDPNADSLVAVTKARQYTWTDGRPDYGEGRIPNSVELPETVVEAMGLYMVRRQPGAPAPTRRFGQTPVLFELTAEECIDINWPDDLALAENVLAGHRAVRNQQLNALRPHLYTTLLADICKERGIRCMLPPELKAVSKGKILGMAKTLDLRPVQTPDEWKGIYTALKSYDFVRPGDVIMARNQVQGTAYFGELNANIAIRSGAVGAVVDGLTRDSAPVQHLEFPVYARGTYSSDIKYEGTVASMNMPITIGDVTINNGDIVFADQDGIAVIPAGLWPEIAAEAIDSMRREFDVRHAVMVGEDLDAILNRLGFF